MVFILLIVFFIIVLFVFMHISSVEQIKVENIKEEFLVNICKQLGITISKRVNDGNRNLIVDEIKRTGILFEWNESKNEWMYKEIYRVINIKEKKEYSGFLHMLLQLDCTYINLKTFKEQEMSISFRTQYKVETRSGYKYLYRDFESTPSYIQMKEWKNTLSLLHPTKEEIQKHKMDLENIQKEWVETIIDCKFGTKLTQNKIK